MALYPYFPTNYGNAYASYYPAAYQPPQVQQQTYSQPTPQNSIVWISGESEAQMYPVAPNNAVALWEQSGKVIYVKSADATGKPSLKVYDLIERETMAEKTENKSDEFASKSDFAAVMGVIKDFSEKVTALTADIESIKGDMYGIAGKKKSVKKVEVEDDE